LPDGAEVAAYQCAKANGCLSVDDAAAAEAAETPERSLHESLDYWGYQTCSEFGFYQTCEKGSRCFFTQGLDLLPTQDAFCAEYAISQPQIARRIAETNAFYGGSRPDLPPHNATRILYANGDVDPWHGLSILAPLSPELPALLVSGASHHAWTHPSLPTDQPSVVAARKAVRRQLAAWLGL